MPKRIRIEYKKDKGKWFDFLMLTPKELKEVVKKTGWRIKKLYEDRTSFYGVVLAKQNA